MTIASDGCHTCDHHRRRARPGGPEPRGEPETFTIPSMEPKDGQLTIDQQADNALNGALRCLSERANSLLKTTYKALRRHRGCPWRLGDIAAAALVLLHHEHGRTT